MRKVLLHIVILALLIIAISPEAFAISSFDEYDDTKIRIAVGNILQLVEGPFGALIMISAGIIALIAAAIGNYRAMVSILVVAVGAFTLRSLLSLFFGTDYFTSI